MNCRNLKKIDANYCINLCCWVKYTHKLWPLYTIAHLHYLMPKKSQWCCKYQLSFCVKTFSHSLLLFCSHIFSKVMTLFPSSLSICHQGHVRRLSCDKRWLCAVTHVTSGSLQSLLVSSSSSVLAEERVGHESGALWKGQRDFRQHVYLPHCCL